MARVLTKNPSVPGRLGDDGRGYFDIGPGGKMVYHTYGHWATIKKAGDDYARKVYAALVNPKGAAAPGAPPAAAGPPAAPAQRDPMSDPTFAGQDAGWRQTRDNIFAGLDDEQRRTNLDYGLIPDASATGTGGYKVDPNNPYSRASEMNRAFESARRGGLLSYANQGQLYSGANEENIGKYQPLREGMAMSSLVKGYGSANADITRRRLAAGDAYTNVHNTGVADWARAIGNNPQDDAGGSDPSAGNDYARLIYTALMTPPPKGKAAPAYPPGNKRTFPTAKDDLKRPKKRRGDF